MMTEKEAWRAGYDRGYADALTDAIEMLDSYKTSVGALDEENLVVKAVVGAFGIASDTLKRSLLRVQPPPQEATPHDASKG
jgi:hypothetical protein